MSESDPSVAEQGKGAASILTEIAAEPDAIRSTVSKVSAALADPPARLGQVDRIFLTGNGTSLYSCELAATWYRAMASSGGPVVTVLSAGEMRHNPPKFGDNDVLVALSASGVQRDVLALVRQLDGRVPLIGVTQASETPLGEGSDLVLEAAGGPGNFPVMTKTFASTATATVLAVASFLPAEASGRVRSLLLEAADCAEAAIDASAPLAMSVAEQLFGYEHGFVFGTGAGGTAAREAALKLKEMALLHAEGDETWEVESGSATIIGEHTFVVALLTDGPGRDATERLAGLSHEWGARVVEVAPGRSVADSLLLPVPEGIPDLVAPFVSVPPVVMVAYHLARARGIDPNNPEWTTRYAQQGLNHVVGSEARQ